MKMPTETQANENPHSCSLCNDQRTHPAKPASTGPADDSEMIALRSVSCDADIHLITALHMPIPPAPKERTSIDLPTGTAPWSHLHVCHVSISECISAIIWVIYHLAVAVKVSSEIKQKHLEP